MITITSFSNLQLKRLKVYIEEKKDENNYF